jgi:glycosyltransferase involved in cell wall biosynthesis
MRVLETCRLDTLPQIIVVDAGGADGTARVVSEVSQQYPNQIMYICLRRPSRGRQLICGAGMATSPFLIFLHADTLLPDGWDTAIIRFFSKHQEVRPLLGCFELDLPRPISSSLRIMLWTANIRAKMGKLPYGDQAYFVRREEYKSIGGFANFPLMEDVDLLRKYKQHHRRCTESKDGKTRRPGFSFNRESCIQVLPLAVVTSPRRWNRKGVWWNTLCNQFYMLAWIAGVSPATIYRWYYGQPIKVAA